MPKYGLSSKDPWIHIFLLPEAFWQAYCGTKIDWKIEKPESEELVAKLCPFCLVLKEKDDAENAPSI